MSQNYQAFLDERCEKLGTNHNDNSLAFAHFSSERIQWNRLFFTDCFLAKFPPEISRETGRIS